MSPALAHALPQSIGAVPLTVVLTAMLAAYLAVGALSTRRAALRVGTTPGAPTTGAPTTDAPTPDAPSATDDVDPTAGDPTTARLTVGRVGGVIGLILIIALATAGPADASSNLTDQAVLALLWGLVALSSILLGAWWHRVDPLRGLSGALTSAIGDPGQDLAHPLRPGLATTAMVTLMVAWAWLQVLATPSVAAFQLALLLYLAIHLLGALRFGTPWLTRVESLTVLSATMGLLRPGDGGPLRRLTALADGDRLRWVCGTLIGWSLVDLVTETDAWHDSGAPAWVGPLLLLLAVAGTYGLIRAVSGRARLGPAFVAVAGAWVVAHYLSILLIEGQGVPIWLSDPFATGADLLGRRGDLIDLEPLPLGLLAALQSIPFVLGHLLALVVVQRRAARIVTRPGQLGLATFFARTLIGVLLLGGTYLQLGGV